MAKHKWTFSARFRKGAYQWNSSRLACQRIKEAISEIKKVSKKAPLLGAEGTVIFFEKIVPSLENVDSSSGALGNSVNNALQELLPLIAKADTSPEDREKLIQRLWTAIVEDGYGYLDIASDYWGDICISSDEAFRIADQLLPIIEKDIKRSGHSSFYHHVSASLSCLLKAERFEEILELLKSMDTNFWSYRYYGAMALLKTGNKSEAIKYAEKSDGESFARLSIDEFCEDVLLSSGMQEEAFKRYALSANRKQTYLATFNSIAKKYPLKEKTEILDELINSSPGEEGKWFATANKLGLYEKALYLAIKSPCNPKTLMRASENTLETNAKYSQECALIAIHWMVNGYDYDITPLDVNIALRNAFNIADHLHNHEEVRKRIEKISRTSKGNMHILKILEQRL